MLANSHLSALDDAVKKLDAYAVKYAHRRTAVRDAAFNKARLDYDEALASHNFAPSDANILAMANALDRALRWA